MDVTQQSTSPTTGITMHKTTIRALMKKLKSLTLQAALEVIPRHDDLLLTGSFKMRVGSNNEKREMSWVDMEHVTLPTFVKRMTLSPICMQGIWPADLDITREKTFKPDRPHHLQQKKEPFRARHTNDSTCRSWHKPNLKFNKAKIGGDREQLRAKKQNNNFAKR